MKHRYNEIDSPETFLRNLSLYLPEVQQVFLNIN